MKKILVFDLIVSLVWFAVFPKYINPLTIEKIAEKMYVIKGADSNSTVLVTDNSVIVVDFGNLPSIGTHMINSIKTVTKKPITHVILTHFHDDHTSGLSSLPANTIIIGHEQIKHAFDTIVIPRWKTTVEKTFPDYMAKKKAALKELKKQNSPDLEKAEKEYAEDLAYVEDYNNIKFIKPTIEYSKSISLIIDGEIIEIKHLGRAHTFTDSIVYFPRQKVLCTGDVVFNEAFPYIDSDTDVTGWITSLKEMNTTTDCTIVVPGHGPVGGKEIIEKQLHLLTDLMVEVKTAFDQGKTLDETKKVVAMTSYSSLQWFSGLGRAVTMIYDELNGDKK